MIGFSSTIQLLLVITALLLASILIVSLYLSHKRYRSISHTLAKTNMDLENFRQELSSTKGQLKHVSEELSNSNMNLSHQYDLHQTDLDVINQLTDHDRLTGFLMSEPFAEEVTKAIDAGSSFSIVYVTIANMKEVSNSLGYTAYESLVQSISTNMVKILDGDKYTFGVVKGDNFILLSQGPRHALDKDLEKLMGLFHSQYFSDYFYFKLLVKVGVSLYPIDGDTNLKLIKRARIAANNVLESPVSELTYYNKALHEKNMDEQRKFAEIDQALNDHQFMMYYQPKFAIDGKTLMGYEALIRWQNPNGDISSPGDFIDFAEHSGQILYIGREVIEMVCRDIKNYELDKKKIHISLNLSSQHLETDETISFLKRTVNKYDIDSRALEIEVTETSLVKNYELTRSLMMRLKNDGFTIALDDFGTGYSSLSYIRNLPINKIKIDREFISRMPNVKYMKVLKAIMNLSKDLYYRVTVEGIETKEQWDMLKPFEPNELQGFYFSKPLPIDDAIKYLE